MFKLRDELSMLDGQARVLSSYAADGASMLGLARITADEAEGFWERHDGGDEVLVMIQGSMTFTMSMGDKVESFVVEPGDALFIPRGVAHSSRLHEPEALILFVTPEQGNVAWNADPTRARRH